MEDNRSRSSPALIERAPSEPWVTLPSAAELGGWGHEQSIAYNQGNRQLHKALFYQAAFDFLTCNTVIGDYYEFGCHRCRTFRMALSEARRHNLENINFYAFDSFDGLPDPTTETSIEIWKRGALSTSETDFRKMVDAHGLYCERVHTIKGFYSDSLTDTLQAKIVSGSSRAMLINIDCDLYESAVPVFKFIEPLLQEGTLIYIDDLFAGYKGQVNKGVARAFLEYQQTSRWSFERHVDIGWWGRSYIVQSERRAVQGII